MPKVVADQRARGGTRGSPVLMVLIAALVLCGVAFVGLMFWTGSKTPTSPQQAASEQQTSSTSSANTSRVPTENPAYPSPAAPSTGTPGSAASPAR
jgi:flagellar basal body-associated protein FliL